MSSLGSSLATQLDRAIEMRKDHSEAFDDHNRTLDKDTQAKWTKMVEDWEVDPNKPNPYEEPETCEYIESLDQVILFSCNLLALNLAEVRLELANEEAADAARGFDQGHNTTPSKFLVQGFELEDQQYVLTTTNIVRALPDHTPQARFTMASVQAEANNPTGSRTTRQTKLDATSYRRLA